MNVSFSQEAGCVQQQLNNLSQEIRELKDMVEEVKQHILEMKDSRSACEPTVELEKDDPTIPPTPPPLPPPLFTNDVSPFTLEVLYVYTYA